MFVCELAATDTAPALYFYHPDHLGSTAMVTNLDGHITQNVVYIPFGEVFVEERDGSWASPYLFNAKELDEETGQLSVLRPSFWGKRKLF